MSRKWFIYYQENVTGPFAAETIYHSHFKNKKDILLWSKGQKSWLSFQNWRKYYNQLKAINSQKPKLWYAENRGEQFGPYTKDQLIQFLSYHKDLSQIYLWTEGQEQWARLFEFNTIMEAIGITRRKFVRAPIVGRVSITRGTQIFYKDISNISVQGLGIKNAFELKAGDLVILKIQSLLIVEDFQAQATIKYVNPSGYAGIEFSKISERSKAYLQDYVKQFG